MLQQPQPQGRPNREENTHSPSSSPSPRSSPNSFPRPLGQVELGSTGEPSLQSCGVPDFRNEADEAVSQRDNETESVTAKTEDSESSVEIVMNNYLVERDVDAMFRRAKEVDADNEKELESSHVDPATNNPAFMQEEEYQDSLVTAVADTAINPSMKSPELYDASLDADLSMSQGGDYSESELLREYMDEGDVSFGSSFDPRHHRDNRDASMMSADKFGAFLCRKNQILNPETQSEPPASQPNDLDISSPSGRIFPTLTVTTSEIDPQDSSVSDAFSSTTSSEASATHSTASSRLPTHRRAGRLSPTLSSERDESAGCRTPTSLNARLDEDTSGSETPEARGSRYPSASPSDNEVSSSVAASSAHYHSHSNRSLSTETMHELAPSHGRSPRQSPRPQSNPSLYGNPSLHNGPSLYDNPSSHDILDSRNTPASDSWTAHSKNPCTPYMDRKTHNWVFPGQGMKGDNYGGGFGRQFYRKPIDYGSSPTELWSAWRCNWCSNENRPIDLSCLRCNEKRVVEGRQKNMGWLREGAELGGDEKKVQEIKGGDGSAWGVPEIEIGDEVGKEKTEQYKNDEQSLRSAPAIGAHQSQQQPSRNDTDVEFDRLPGLRKEAWDPSTAATAATATASATDATSTTTTTTKGQHDLQPPSSDIVSSWGQPQVANTLSTATENPRRSNGNYRSHRREVDNFSEESKAKTVTSPTLPLMTSSIAQWNNFTNREAAEGAAAWKRRKGSDGGHGRPQERVEGSERMKMEQHKLTWQKGPGAVVYDGPAKLKDCEGSVIESSPRHEHSAGTAPSSSWDEWSPRQDYAAVPLVLTTPSNPPKSGWDADVDSWSSYAPPNPSSETNSWGFVNNDRGRTGSGIERDAKHLEPRKDYINNVVPSIVPADTRSSNCTTTHPLVDRPGPCQGAQSSSSSSGREGCGYSVGQPSHQDSGNANISENPWTNHHDNLTEDFSQLVGEMSTFRGMPRTRELQRKPGERLDGEFHRYQYGTSEPNDEDNGKGKKLNDGGKSAPQTSQGCSAKGATSEGLRVHATEEGHDLGGPEPTFSNSSSGSPGSPATVVPDLRPEKVQASDGTNVKVAKGGWNDESEFMTSYNPITQQAVVSTPSPRGARTDRAQTEQLATVPLPGASTNQPTKAQEQPAVPYPNVPGSQPAGKIQEQFAIPSQDSSKKHPIVKAQYQPRDEPESDSQPLLARQDDEMYFGGVRASIYSPTSGFDRSVEAQPEMRMRGVEHFAGGQQHTYFDPQIQCVNIYRRPPKGAEQFAGGQPYSCYNEPRYFGTNNMYHPDQYGDGVFRSQVVDADAGSRPQMIGERVEADSVMKSSNYDEGIYAAATLQNPGFNYNNQIRNDLLDLIHKKNGAISAHPMQNISSPEVVVQVPPLQQNVDATYQRPLSSYLDTAPPPLSGMTSAVHLTGPPIMNSPNSLLPADTVPPPSPRMTTSTAGSDREQRFNQLLVREERNWTTQIQGLKDELSRERDERINGEMKHKIEMDALNKRFRDLREAKEDAEARMRKMQIRMARMEHIIISHDLKFSDDEL